MSDICEPLLGCGQNVVKKAVIVEETTTVLAISNKLFDFIASQPNKAFKGSNGFTVRCSGTTTITSWNDHMKKLCLARVSWAGKRVRLEELDNVSTAKQYLIKYYKEIVQVLIEASKACKATKYEPDTGLFLNLETF